MTVVRKHRIPELTTNDKIAAGIAWLLLLLLLLTASHGMRVLPRGHSASRWARDSRGKEKPPPPQAAIVGLNLLKKLLLRLDLITRYPGPDSVQIQTHTSVAKCQTIALHTLGPSPSYDSHHIPRPNHGRAQLRQHEETQ